jgi:hypothetical protein
MSIEEQIDSIGGRLQILRQRLDEEGFQFDNEDEVLPGPDDDTDEIIEEIENEAGVIPVSLKLFWQRVGSVNFCGGHPDWQLDPDCEPEGYTDPIFVYPPSVALEELESFLSDKEERLRCSFPYLVPIAPDFKHKADVSGGMWYNISVPAVADDPPLNAEWHKTTFLNYLEIALKWAGFPGLERLPKHTWPIAKLVEGF